MHKSTDLRNTKKSFFLGNHEVHIFLFVNVIILLIVPMDVLFTICKDRKLKSLVSSIAVQQIKEMGVVTKQEQASEKCVMGCTCKHQWYRICMLTISLLAVFGFIVFNVRKIKLYREHLFSYRVRVVLFISDAQYYVPTILCRVTCSIHLFRIPGRLSPEHVKLGKHCHQDISEIDWKQVNITLLDTKRNYLHQLQSH